MNTIFQSRYAPVPLFLLAALFILTGPLFWLGVEAPGGDRSVQVGENTMLFQQVVPGMHYGFNRLRQGDFPLWNNQQLCGTPYFADPRHALLQPLNAVFLFFETPRAMALHAFLTLALMGFFFALFMRSMDLRHLSAALGGMAYMCCGATAAAMSRPAYANALVWLPLLCCLVRESMMRPRAALTVAGGFVTAFLLLSGAPLLIAVGVLAAFGYGLAALLFDPLEGDNGEYRNWDRIGSLAGMFALGLLLSCVQWAPTMAWLRGLAAPGAFLAHFAVAGEAPYSVRGLLAQLLEAHAARLPALAYMGVVALLLLPAAFFHSLPRWERAFMGVLAFGSMAVMLAGIKSPTSSGALLALIYPASFAASALVALGADRLFAARRDPLTPRLWGPLLLISIVFVFLFVLAPGSTRGRMVPFAAAILLFSLFRTRWAGMLSSAVLLLFLFIDLNSSMANHQAHPFFVQSDAPVVEARLAALLRETALDDRILVSTWPSNNQFHANIGMSDGFRMAGAAAIPLTREQRLWWDALDGGRSAGEAFSPSMLDISGDSAYGPLLHVMAVRAVAATDGGALNGRVPTGLRLRRRGDYGDVVVFVNEDVLPRISWARSWQIALDINAAIEAISAPAFNSNQECIIVPADTALSHLVGIIPDQRPTPVGVAPELDPPASMRLLEDQPERVSIAVANPAPGLLILSDSYDAGWRAYVDGQPAPMLRANGLFRGVVLPQGEHIVEFRYRPLSFYLGACVSIATLAALFAFGLRGLLRRRTYSSPESPGTIL